MSSQEGGRELLVDNLSLIESSSMQRVLLYYEYSCINSVYRNYIVPFDQIRLRTVSITFL